jgi:adenylate cyclase
VVLRGRASPVDLFEPAPDFPAADRDALAAALALLATDRAAAIAGVTAVAASHRHDLALQNLVKRLGDLDEGGSYVLG